MARACYICGKKPTVTFEVSHAHNRTKRRVYPNLKRVNAKLAGRKHHVLVCTRCIRSGRISK